MAKKLPEWVAPVAGVGIGLGVIGGIAAYLLSKPTVVDAEKTDDAGVTYAAQHEQIPVRAVIRDFDGASIEYYDFPNVDLAYAYLKRRSADDWSKTQYKKELLSWQIRDEAAAAAGGGDAAAVMYEGKFPPPADLPMHAPSYVAYKMRKASEAAAAEKERQKALEPVTSDASYQFFNIRYVVSPTGVTKVTVTDPSGKFVQENNFGTKYEAESWAKSIIDAEMKGKQTTYDHRGYKIVVTYYASRDPRLGSKYEVYYVRPSGTTSQVVSADSADKAIESAKGLINQEVGTTTETTYYKNFAINVDYNGNAKPPYTLRIYDEQGQRVTIAYGTGSGAFNDTATALAAGKKKVDEILTRRAEQAAYDASKAKTAATAATASEIVAILKSGQIATYKNWKMTKAVTPSGSHVIRLAMPNGTTVSSILMANTSDSEYINKVKILMAAVDKQTGTAGTVGLVHMRSTGNVARIIGRNR